MEIDRQQTDKWIVLLDEESISLPPKNEQCWRNSNKNSPEKTTREIKTEILGNSQKAKSLQ